MVAAQFVIAVTGTDPITANICIGRGDFVGDQAFAHIFGARKTQLLLWSHVATLTRDTKNWSAGHTKTGLPCAVTARKDDDPAAV